MSLSAAVLLSACGSQTAAPPSAPASAPPTVVTPQPSPPADTPTPAPTNTPVPTATPRPAIHSPLTGLPVASLDDVTRRPLLVKLGNSGDERPQSGLSQADVVYESVTEGGITRYAAAFQSREATAIGPVRSARLSDLQIAPEFSAVLAHVGASSPIMTMLRGGSVLDLDQFFYQQYYQRPKDRQPPYNVYTSTAALRTGAKDRGYSPSIPQLAPYAFETEAPDGGSASTIDFDFAPETHVQYVYDAAQHAYHQIEYGTATTDAVTGHPVPIANLIVQFAPVQVTDIVEDKNGSRSLDYKLVGSGKALVFHDGIEAQGTWARRTLTSRTSFSDAAGKAIAFAAGSVWIALVRPEIPVSVRSL
ncbi:MAG: DUF3048 domain-containing protein [Chloroflexota bacterium]